MYENNTIEEMSMKLTIVECTVPKEVVVLNLVYVFRAVYCVFFLKFNKKFESADGSVFVLNLVITGSAFCFLRDRYSAIVRRVGRTSRFSAELYEFILPWK
jgi:hypothetical protein